MSSFIKIYKTISACCGIFAGSVTTINVHKEFYRSKKIKTVSGGVFLLFVVTPLSMAWGGALGYLFWPAVPIMAIHDWELERLERR